LLARYGRMSVSGDVIVDQLNNARNHGPARTFRA
jgi:hypothetical protein